MATKPRSKSPARASKRAPRKTTSAAPLKESERLRLGDLIALMKAATREFEIYTNPRAVFPDLSDQEVQWFKEDDPPQRRRLERALLSWEERAGAVYNELRGPGSRPLRLRPGAFAALHASKDFDPSKDRILDRPRTTLSDDELIEHATAHAERLLSSDESGRASHLYWLSRTVRTLYEREVHDDRVVPSRITTPVRRDDAACERYIQSELPPPARRGQRRGRKSATTLVAKLLGFDDKTVTAACKRAAARGTTLSRRLIAQWRAARADEDLRKGLLSPYEEAMALWEMADPLADRW